MLAEWLVGTHDRPPQPAPEYWRSPALSPRADERIRTADPFITSEVLYQLSYVGAQAMVAPVWSR